jgi:hypothetical protein
MSTSLLYHGFGILGKPSTANQAQRDDRAHHRGSVTRPPTPCDVRTALVTFQRNGRDARAKDDRENEDIGKGNEPFSPALGHFSRCLD